MSALAAHIADSTGLFMRERCERRECSDGTHPDAANMHIRFTSVSAPAAAGSRYVLDVCLDTAPFGDEAAWTYPPTSGEIDGGWLHGRGACDSKAGAAIFAHAAARLLPVSDQLAGSLVLLFESMSTPGISGRPGLLRRYRRAGQGRWGHDRLPGPGSCGDRRPWRAARPAPRARRRQPLRQPYHDTERGAGSPQQSRSAWRQALWETHIPRPRSRSARAFHRSSSESRAGDRVGYVVGAPQPTPPSQIIPPGPFYGAR